MKPLELRHLDLLESSLNRQVADYWFKLADNRPTALPDKAEIDPLALGKALPHLCLIDVRPDGSFAYRLVGEWVRGLGVRRGKTVGNLNDGDSGFQSCDGLRRCLSERLPLWDRQSYGQPGGQGVDGEGTVKIEALVLPLTARPGTGRIDFLLTCGDFCKAVVDSGSET